MLRIVCLVIGYIFGCLQFPYFIGKINKIDIRKFGSGNAGTTNVYRTLGKGWGFLTLFLDMLKGVFALIIALIIMKDNPLIGMIYASLGAVIGHCFPFFLNFKGGKGVAVSLGIMFFLDWQGALIALGVFLLTVIITRYVSLGSLIMEIAFFVSSIIRYPYISSDPGKNYFIEATIVWAVLVLIIIFRHVTNISRLLQGKESKFSFKKKG